MCIVLHTPKVGQYDPTEAINLWNSASIRSKRPDIQPYESRSSSFVKDSASKSPKVGGLESPTKNGAASNADSQSLSETDCESALLTPILFLLNLFSFSSRERKYRIGQKAFQFSLYT